MAGTQRRVSRAVYTCNARRGRLTLHLSAKGLYDLVDQENTEAAVKRSAYGMVGP